jgi:hypothetical protein
LDQQDLACYRFCCRTMRQALVLMKETNKHFSFLADFVVY